MTDVLSIDCSPNPDAVTRQLADRFIAAWCNRHPGKTVHARDLGAEPVPHVSQAFVQAITTPLDRRSSAMHAAAAYADTLAAEFLSAERYVLSMPMRILNVPSTFKAYVEHIFHEGKVFRVGLTGYEGLLGERKVVCINARGGDYRAASPIQRFDVLEPYIRLLFEFCGVLPANIAVINVHAMFADPQSRAAAADDAAAQLDRLAAIW